MSMRVVIVDDEHLVRKSVRRFLENHNAEVVAECGDGRLAIETIQALAPDIVLLDMQMPEMNGMSVLEEIGEARMPATIVLTAHDNYAVQAFEYRVADYVLKPFGRERFDKAYTRALDWATTRKNTHTEPPAGEDHTANQYLERVAVPTRNGRISLVETSQIHWIEADGNFIHIHTADRVFELRETLAALARKLDPGMFLRIHRSRIVNVRHIKEVLPWNNGYHIVQLTSGNTLRASRYQRESMKRLLGF